MTEITEPMQRSDTPATPLLSKSSKQGYRPGLLRDARSAFAMAKELGEYRSSISSMQQAFDICGPLCDISWPQQQEAKDLYRAMTTWNLHYQFERIKSLEDISEQKTLFIQILDECKKLIEKQSPRLTLESFGQKLLGQMLLWCLAEGGSSWIRHVGQPISQTEKEDAASTEASDKYFSYQLANGAVIEPDAVSVSQDLLSETEQLAYGIYAAGLLQDALPQQFKQEMLDYLRAPDSEEEIFYLSRKARKIVAKILFVKRLKEKELQEVNVRTIYKLAKSSYNNGLIDVEDYINLLEAIASSKGNGMSYLRHKIQHHLFYLYVQKAARYKQDDKHLIYKSLKRALENAEAVKSNSEIGENSSRKIGIKADKRRVRTLKRQVGDDVFRLSNFQTASYYATGMVGATAFLLALIPAALFIVAPVPLGFFMMLGVSVGTGLVAATVTGACLFLVSKAYKRLRHGIKHNRENKRTFLSQPWARLKKLTASNNLLSQVFKYSFAKKAKPQNQRSSSLSNVLRQIVQNSTSADDLGPTMPSEATATGQSRAEMPEGQAMDDRDTGDLPQPNYPPIEQEVREELQSSHRGTVHFARLFSHEADILSERKSEASPSPSAPPRSDTSEPSRDSYRAVKADRV